MEADEAPRVLLLRRRHRLLRLDTAPFLAGYALVFATYLARPALEQHVATCTPLLVVAHALTFLITHWSVTASIDINVIEGRTEENPWGSQRYPDICWDPKYLRENPKERKHIDEMFC